MSQARSIAALTGAALLFSSTAFAHVSITSGPTFAGGRQVLTFGTGHGCEGADTVSIEVSIPEEVVELRPVYAPGFETTVTTNDAMLVTKVKWSKDEAREADDTYYAFGLRITVPDMPFKTLVFPAKQTCRAADGTETVVDWAVLPEDIVEGEEGEPAPTLVVLPAHKNGWNKVTVPSKLEDLSIFDDAQIVWSGDAAYSSNETTKELIASEADVTELTEIAAGAEIWVKY